MDTTETKSILLKHPRVKNILSALMVAAIGFVLLNLTFLLYFLVFRFFDIFAHGNPESMHQWIPIARGTVFLAIIALISWIIFRSKLPVIIKATFMTVPTAVTLVTLGIILYPSPILPYLVGGLLTIGVLFYFYRTNKPWLYYYSVILVALTLMIFNLTGGEM
jgi:hypothetical protein